MLHEFWDETTSVISHMIGDKIPVDPIILLLNDDSKLNLCDKQRKIGRALCGWFVDGQVYTSVVGGGRTFHTFR